MNDLSDFEFDSDEKKKKERDELATGAFPDGDGGDGSKRWWWIALLLIAIAGGVVYWLTRSPSEGEPAATPAPPEAVATPRAEPETVEPIELPALDASDDLVARLVGALSANPRLASLLVGDGLVRRFTASIVNISEGESPKVHLDALKPAEPFTVRRIGDGLVPSAKSYARYDQVANVISSLDVKGTVRLYRQLEPLIDEAFADLGYPGRDFDELLVGALDRLIATPVVDENVELVEQVAVYKYADPELEALSSAQKQLLRTGPENMRKIQATLRSLRRELMQSD